MTLFSTGFFDLSEDDIKNMDNIDGLKKNNDYNQIKKTFSKISFISSIVLGGSSILLIFFGFPISNTLARIIFIIFFIIVLLLITISGYLEMSIDNKIFELTGNFPSFLNEDIVEMKAYNSKLHFFPYLPLLILQILFLIIYILRYRKEKNKNSIFDKKTKDNKSCLIQEKTSNFSNEYNDQEKVTPQNDYLYDKPN